MKLEGLGTVSIIVPVYHCEAYLSECIESILGQSYRDLELILVDDGSKDASGEICDAYAIQDGRVVVHHKPNGGVSSTRNKGLELATGKYLMFVDSDDRLDRQAVAHMVNLMEDDHVDCVLCGITLFGDGYETPYLYALPDARICMATDISTHYRSIRQNKGFNAVVAKLFRKEMVDAHGIRSEEAFSILEDGMFVSDYLQYCESIRTIAPCYYEYRQLAGDSLVKRFNRGAIEALATLYRKDGWILPMLQKEELDLYYSKLFSFLWNSLIRLYSQSTLSSAEKKALLVQYLGAEITAIVARKNQANPLLSRKKRFICHMLSKPFLPVLHGYLTRSVGTVK